MEEEALTPEEFAQQTSAQSEDDPGEMTQDQFRAASAQDTEDLPAELTPEEFAKHEGTATRSGVAGRGVARGALPAGGGLAAGLYAGALAAPLGPIASIGTGLAVGLGAGTLLGVGQQKLAEILGMDTGASPFNPRQEQTDEALHRYIKFGSEAAPAALTLKPTGSLAQRALGAGIGGLAGAGEQALHGEFDWGKVLEAAAIGGALPSTNRLGQAIERAGTRTPPPKPTGPTQGPWPNGQPQGPQQPQGGLSPQGAPMWQTPPGPARQGDLVPQGARTWEAQDRGREIIPPKPEVNGDLEFARTQRDFLDPSDPLHGYWDDYVGQLEAKASGKGIVDVDASQGPHSDVNAFTYHDTDLANDVTTVAQGIAAENPPAPRVQGAGNPVGAPMEARDAARPNSPLRDYRKVQPQSVEHSADSTPLSEAPIHEDISLALTFDADRPARPANAQGPIREVPRQPEAPLPEPQLSAPAPEHPAEATARTLSRMDPMEAAQIEREARGRAETAAAERARGLDEDVVQGPLNPDRKARPANEPRPSEDVTAAVTLDDLKVLAKAKGHLEEAAQSSPQYKQFYERFNALSGEEQIAAARKINEAVGDKTPASARPKLETGVQGRSKADVENKEGSLNAAKAAFDTYADAFEGVIPTDTAGRLRTVELAKEAFEHAKKLNGGQSPLETYRPNVKPAEWQFLREAVKLVKLGGSIKNINDFYSAVKNLRAGGAKDVQDTARIKADTEKKPTIDLASAEAMINKAREGEPQGRPEYETFQNPHQKESATYTAEHNTLTEWLNGLSDEAHAKLLRENPDLALDVGTTANPRNLLQQYKNDLTRTRQGRILEDVTDNPEAFGVTEQPKEKVIAGKAYEPPEAGAKANEGRRIDPASPEGKAIAEAALSSRPAVRRDLDHELAQAREGAQDVEPAEGTWKAAEDKFRQMMGDTSGSLRIPAWLQQGRNRLFSPDANQATKEAAEHFSKEFHINAGVITNLASQLGAHFATIPKALSKTFREGVYEKLEKNAPLTPAEQSFVDTYVKPLQDMHARVYKAWQRVNPDLPDPYSGGSARHVPRLAHETQPLPDVDQPWKYNLSDWHGSLEEREFKTLEDTAGNRILFHIDPADGKVVLFRGARGPTRLNAPSFDGKEGSTVTFNVAGKPRTFTVDHAYTSEIEKAFPNKKFVKDPVIVYSNATYGMQQALIKHNMLERLKTNQVVLDNSTTDKKTAIERGYRLEPTILEGMDKRGDKPLYLEERLRWNFDDLAKSGIQLGDADFLNTFANTAAKPLYILSPLFHPLNVADNWAHAMASELLNPTKYPVIANEAMRAIREVFTQGPLAREFQAAGGRLMYRSQMFDKGLINGMMKNAGYELARKPSIFDPITKATGMDIPEFMHWAMSRSNGMMWAPNDMLALSLYQRNKRLGMDPRTAVDATHDWIGNYASDSPTFMGSRTLQKIANTPVLSWFGRYHQDLWRTIGKIAGGLDPTSSATPQQRKDAVGALVMSGLLMFGLYPYMLDKGAQLLTQNPHSEFGRRGLSAIQDAAYKMQKGDQSYTRLFANVLTPSIPLQALNQAMSGRNWQGKEIVPPSGGPVKSLARAADWAASALIPPFATVAGEFKKPGGTPLSAAKKFAESTVGIREPSPAELKYKGNLGRNQMREEKVREKKPGGPFEWLSQKYGR